MKKIIVLAIALIITISSIAQETNCRVKKSVDDYTGKLTIETEFIDFERGVYLLNKENQKIIMWLSLENDEFYMIPTTEFIYFKLSDGSILKFPVTDKSYGEYYVDGDYYRNNFAFYITGTKLEELKRKKIVGIKCYISEYKFSETDAEVFRDNVNCLINTK